MADTNETKLSSEISSLFEEIANTIDIEERKKLVDQVVKLYEIKNEIDNRKKDVEEKERDRAIQVRKNELDEDKLKFEKEKLGLEKERFQFDVEKAQNTAKLDHEKLENEKIALNQKIASENRDSKMNIINTIITFAVPAATSIGLAVFNAYNYRSNVTRLLQFEKDGTITSLASRNHFGSMRPKT